MALAEYATGQHWSRGLRVLGVVGAFTATSLLLDLAGSRRDRILLPTVALLTSLGVILVSRIDGYLASKQILWVVVGCGALIATYYLLEPVSSLANWKYLAGAGALLLMVVTIIFAPEKNGARLWLSFAGRFSFQPSEVAKLLMVIFLAGYVAEKGPLLRQVGGRRGVSLWQARYLAPMLIMVLLCLGLFVGQRDLGTAALFFGLFVTMLYLATGHPTHAVVSLLLFVGGVALAYQHYPHLARRFSAWLDPWSSLTGAGYQPAQALFALAEGGVGGAGLGLLPVTPRNLPAASTDMIFAVLGQDLGLAGSVAVLLLFALLVVAGCRIAWLARDPFDAALAAGLTAMFALQAFIIVGGVLRVIPLTGLPLPLVSYGGTSMLINCLALGLLLAISREESLLRPEQTG